MENESLQDQWPEIGTYCWGCGRNNEHGLQIKSYWQEDECVCTWKPKRYHCATPGTGCGGIIAAILDCHCLNTAISAVLKAEGQELDPNAEPTVFYVTGTLTVQFYGRAKGFGIVLGVCQRKGIRSWRNSSSTSWFIIYCPPTLLIGVPPPPKSQTGKITKSFLFFFSFYCY
jgi:hypothetical protein